MLQVIIDFIMSILGSLRAPKEAKGIKDLDMIKEHEALASDMKAMLEKLIAAKKGIRSFK